MINVDKITMIDRYYAKDECIWIGSDFTKFDHGEILTHRLDHPLRCSGGRITVIHL